MSDNQTPPTGDIPAAVEVTEAPLKKITNSDLIKSWLIWTFFSHSNYNYERLQATAFAHSMVPVIKRLYGGSKEETAEALKRHLVFFNTEPNWGGMIHGATIAMEEQRASGRPVTDTAINSMKTGLMGPIAGVGDTIDQGILVPIFLALGISITGVAAGQEVTAGQVGNPLGPIVYVLLISVFSLTIAYLAYTQGYRQGRTVVSNIFKSGLMDRVMVGATVLGNMVLGGLSAQYILLFLAPKIDAGGTTIRLQQDVLDKILPGILPLGLVVLSWWLLKRGWHPIKLMVIYLAACIIGAIPFFGPAPQYVTDACGSAIFSPYSACAVEQP